MILNHPNMGQKCSIILRVRIVLYLIEIKCVGLCILTVIKSVPDIITSLKSLVMGKLFVPISIGIAG